MKINKYNTITALACSTLLAVATTSIAQPLVDGSFETDAPGVTPVAWTFNLSGGTATNTTLYAQSGSQSLVIDSTGAGAWSSPNAYQSFPASPGQEFNFKGYMLRSGAITDASFGLLKIEFKNASGGILLPASASIGTINNSFPGIESTPFLNNGNVAANTWLLTQAQGVAPANTASVQFYLLNVNQGIAPGPMYFDNITATEILPPPNSASITSPANGATLTPNFTINALASLPGVITNVYFYTNNAIIGNLDTTPYNFPVTGAADGAYALKVVARGTNNLGGSISVTSSVVNVTVISTATVYVDPSKSWLGYMNVSETPLNGSIPVFGSAWGVADLRANWSGSMLTLSPNTINDPAAFWYVDTNSPSVGNKIMEANMYVEPAGSLPGVTVTFTGMCISDTMTDLANTNTAGDGWTCVAFIKDFAPDYSSFVGATIPVANGMKFSVSLATDPDPARHVQYGFVTTGPCVWAADTFLPSYGNVVIAPGPAVAITPSVSGANVNLSFPSVIGYNYQAQYKNSLTDANWINLGASASGTGSTIVLTDTHTLPSRFYRLSVQ